MIARTAATRTVLLADAGIAVMLGLLAGSLWLAGSLLPVGFASVLIIMAAVTLRRALPGTALALAWVSAAVQMLTDQSVSVMQFGTIIVVYSAAAWGNRVVLWLAGLSVPVGTIVADVYLGFRGDWYVYRLVPFDPTQDQWIETVIISLLPLAALLMPWLAGLLVRTLRKNRSQLEEAERLRVEAERTAQIVDLQRQKAHLARDVHDVVGHSLAVIIAQADSVRFLPAEDADRVRAAVATIADTARTSLAEVRSVLADIDVNPAESRSIDELLGRIAATGVGLDVDVTGEPGTWSGRAGEASYRVAQEMLTNALKFGDPRVPIVVREDWSADRWRLSVRNAIRPSARLEPAAPEEPATAVSRGIAGMRARLAEVGGRIATSEDEGWFRVDVELPRAGGHEHSEGAAR